MSEDSKIFIHCKTNDKKQFPTAENFVRPKSLNDDEDYPFRIGDGKGYRVFWLSPKTGEETSPWIEYSREKYKQWEERVAKTFPDGVIDCGCTDYGAPALENGHTERCIMNDYLDWHLSPHRTYALSDDAKIYHIRTSEDYKKATMLYPGFRKIVYDNTFIQDHKDPCGEVYYYLCQVLEKFFTSPLKELENVMLASGSTQKEIDQIKPKATGPYIYHSVYIDRTDYYKPKKIKKHIASFNSWGDYISITHSRIKKSQYTHRKAYAQLKYHISQLERMSREYYDSIEGDIEGYGIDYNRLREEGYQGVYLHAQAITEGKVEADKIDKENARNPVGVRNKLNVYSDLCWWKTESMFVWDWCFE